MKTRFLSFLITLFSMTFLFAQRGMDRQNMYQLNRVKNDKFQLNDNLEFLRNRKTEVNHEKVVRTHKWDNKSYVTTYIFNDKGQISEIQRKNSTQRMSYFNDSLISTIDLETKKGIKHTEIKYHDNKKVLEETFKNNRLTSRVIIQYDDQNRVVFSSIDAKKNYSMAYTYNDEKLSWQRFMKNEKVLKEWDYSCKKEGDLVKTKNQQSVCKYEQENNDGSRIEFMRTEENGNIYLRKDYYNSSSVKYLNEVFRNETILSSRTKISQENGNETEYFDEKGEITEKSFSKYDSLGNVSEFRRYKIGKENKATKSIFKYNEQNELIESTYFYKGKMTSQNLYEYIN